MVGALLALDRRMVRALLALERGIEGPLLAALYRGVMGTLLALCRSVMWALLALQRSVVGTYVVARWTTSEVARWTWRSYAGVIEGATSIGMPGVRVPVIEREAGCLHRRDGGGRARDVASWSAAGPAQAD